MLLRRSTATTKKIPWLSLQVCYFGPHIIVWMLFFFNYL